MPTYLLTWNPKKWNWPDLQQCVDEVKENGLFRAMWSCGISTQLVEGDRFFMLKQGVEPRGIFGAGLIESGVMEKPHWDREKRKLGKKARCVKVKWDVLLNPDNEEIFPREWLNQSPFKKAYWNTQMSGITIPDDVAEELEKRWASFLEGKNTNFSLFDYKSPDELDENEEFFEGAAKKVLVNVYERNPEARRKCLEHYNFDCYICDFNFERVYGAIGKNFIHVHHLKPLSEIGEKYKLDPIKDLRPICPNCHAIVHKRMPPYSIEEIQEMLLIRTS
jgi:5-methylcytosine-specific restriction enzyme A